MDRRRGHALDARPQRSAVGCNLRHITEAALAAARARGYEPTQYTTQGIAIPQIDCPWTGSYFPPGIWLNGQMNRHLIAHELGHTYGVMEEGPAWVCNPTCHGEPYGNPFSVMGDGLSDYGAWEKSQFGWLGDVPRAERAGRFAIVAIDRPSTDPQALRVLVAWRRVLARVPAAGNYVIADPARRGRPSVQTGETFTVGGAFAVTVTSADAARAEVAFRWTDRVRPGAPRVLRPLRRGRRLIVRWSRGRERGSGIAAHDVYLDGQRAARVAAVRAAAGVLVTNDDRITLRVSRGRHRLAVVAVDRAGNRSRPSRLILRA